MTKWTKNKTEYDGFEIKTNCYTKDETLFIPYRQEGVEYYYVDYNDRQEHRWVRTPCQTLEDIKKILYYIQTENKEVADFRITPENYLSQLHRSWNEEKQHYITDNFTNREHMFGGRDEMFAEKFFEVRSLRQGGFSLVFENTSGETREEWKQRVKDTIAIRGSCIPLDFEEDITTD